MIEKFCEHFDVISGYAFKSADLKDDGDIPVIKIGNISSGANVVEDSTTQYVSKDFLKINEKYHIKKDDILISLTGSHINQPNSMVGRVCRNYRDRIYLLNQRAGKVIPKKIESRDYIFYLLSSKCIKEDIANRAYGAANQVNISSSAIGNIKWDFPSIDMQKKIGDVLSSFDNLIETNNKRIKILEQMAENLYKEWFVRFRFPGYETAEFVEGVPKGWKRCRLKEFINFNPNYKTEKKQYYTNIPMAALSTNGMYINEAEISLEEKSSGTHFRNGDVLFAKITPCLENGKTGLVTCLKDNEIGVGSTEFIVMQGAKVSSFFTYCIARNDLFRQLAINSMNGADGRQRADISFIQNIKWILPDDEILLKFEHITSAIIKQINILHKQNQNLIKQRDYLLPRLMSGKLQVK